MKLILAFIGALIFVLPQLGSAGEYAWVVRDDSSNDDVVVQRGGGDLWLLHYGYGCSFGFLEGERVVLSYSYSLDSYGSKIISDSSYLNKECDIQEANEVTELFTVNKVIDADDQIIGWTEKNETFLIEYGIGCLSMWRFEGKPIYIDRGGTFLDGIGDRIYLPDDSGDCSVWSAEEITTGTTSPSATYSEEELRALYNLLLESSQNTTTYECPDNSSELNGSCYCDDGYILNSDKTMCVVKTTQNFCVDPVNGYLDTDGECYCNAGYLWSDEQDKCVVETVSESNFIFNDVNSAYVFSDAVKYVKDQGIVDGYPDGTYKPNNSINRAEFVKIVLESLYDDIPNAVNQCLEDVDLSQWYAKYVCFAKDKGIIGGYPDGTFRPTQEVNVVEALKIVLEGFFGDIPEVNGEWYAKYEAYAKANDYYLESYWGDISDELARGEMAELIYRIEMK